MSEQNRVVTEVKMTPASLDLIHANGSKGYAPSVYTGRFVKVHDVRQISNCILDFGWDDGCGIIRETLTVGQVVSLVGHVIPTVETIQNVKVGGQAPDYVGRMMEVTEVYGRGIQQKTGLPFVCYYTKHGDNGSVSNSLLAGELHHSASLAHKYDAQAMWQIGKLVDLLVILPQSW